MGKLDVIQSRPGMYVLPYDQQLDGGSLCANFLYAFFTSSELGRPDHVDFTVAGPHFALSATGENLDTDKPELRQLPQLFDVSTDIDSQSLHYLRPLAWFTEYCLFNILTTSGTYQHAFQHGLPIGEVVHIPSEEDDEPCLSFSFTLTRQVFTGTVLSHARLKRLISVWKQMQRRWMRLDGLQTPRLQCRWRIQSDYFYSVRIVPESKTNTG